MNSHRTMPVSELGTPDEAAISKLSSDDIFRILGKNVRLGRAICVSFYVIGFVICLVLIFYRITNWAITTLILSVAFKTGAMLSQQKLELAYRISTEPQLIYWIHPHRSHTIGYACFLTLHSRTGKALEVPMSREQALKIVTWFRRQNSEIRIGDYDNTPLKPV